VCVICTYRGVDIPRACVVCAYMCVLCVHDMYIQRCRHALERTHIHILMQMPMYVEVWNIMACNLDVPDPNKQERTPDMVRERPWCLLDSCQHIVDRRERRTPSHARPRAGTHPHTCMQTDTWHSRTHTHTQTPTRTRKYTHTHAHRLAHVHKHANTPKQTRTHTHARTQTLT